jgi:hypothetical protein
MYAWLAAYRDEDATVAGDWHDRYRPGVVKRIRAVAGTCPLENYQSSSPRFATAAPVPLIAAMAPISEWWARDRRDVPPVPTDEQFTPAERVTITKITEAVHRTNGPQGTP